MHNAFLDLLKGHSQLWDRADPDTTFVSLKSVYLNPKSNVPVGYIYKSALILPSVSFHPRSFTENLFLSKLLFLFAVSAHLRRKMTKL